MTFEERAAHMCYRACHLAAVSQSVFSPDDCRAVAAYLVVTHGNVPSATLGRAIGCSRQNMSKILRRIEDAREHAPFERVLSAMETAMQEAL